MTTVPQADIGLSSVMDVAVQEGALMAVANTVAASTPEVEAIAVPAFTAMVQESSLAPANTNTFDISAADPKFA